MTEGQLRTLPFTVTMFASLTKGGHMQVRRNEQYAITMTDTKKDRNSEWKRTFVVTIDGEQKECDNFAELVEAVKDVPFEEVPA